MSKPRGGHQLAELVKKAMDDLEITPAEYEEIMNLAAADSVIDASERAVLEQFQAMIADGTIRRVRK